MFDVGKIWESIIAVLLAAAGGIARLLSMKDTKKVGWSRILSELFVSGFTGLMVLMIARASGVSGDWVGVLAGMSGWIGPRALDLLAKMVGKATGVDMNQKNDVEMRDNK